MRNDAGDGPAAPPRITMSAPSQPSSSAVPSLVPEGPHAGERPMTLNRVFTLIGSAPSARLYLPSKSVSRCHAVIVNTDTGLFVRDLASRTQVLVNGQPVREADLEDGDLVQIGPFIFRFTGAPAAPARSGPAKPSVVTLDVEGLDEPLRIEDRVVLIGRRETADISLTENAASSAHAVIVATGGGHMLRDLNSRTGTFVNGIKIHEQVLKPGDVIRIGETTMRYAGHAAAAPSAPPPAPAAPAKRADASKQAGPAKPTETPAAALPPPVPEPAEMALAEETPLAVDREVLPGEASDEPPAGSPAGHFSGQVAPAEDASEVATATDLLGPDEPEAHARAGDDAQIIPLTFDAEEASAAAQLEDASDAAPAQAAVRSPAVPPPAIASPTASLPAAAPPPPPPVVKPPSRPIGLRPGPDDSQEPTPPAAGATPRWRAGSPFAPAGPAREAREPRIPPAGGGERQHGATAAAPPTPPPSAPTPPAPRPPAQPAPGSPRGTAPPGAPVPPPMAAPKPPALRKPSAKPAKSPKPAAARPPRPRSPFDMVPGTDPEPLEELVADDTENGDAKDR